MIRILVFVRFVKDEFREKLYFFENEKDKLGLCLWFDIEERKNNGEKFFRLII